MSTKWIAAAVVAGGSLLAGCGQGPERAVVQGTVKVGESIPEVGEIRFVPIDGTPGSMNAAVIVDGAYEVAGRGGLAPGKYRVEIVARRKTGKKVERYNGFEMAMVDEEIPLGPPEYATASSPLVFEFALGGDGQADFTLPAAP